MGGGKYIFKHFRRRLGVSPEMHERPVFAGKYVPRGTLLWNGNPQHLVYVNKFFICIEKAIRAFFV